MHIQIYVCTYDINHMCSVLKAPVSPHTAPTTVTMVCRSRAGGCMGPHNQSEGVHVPCADVINLVGLDSYDASSAVASKHWVAPVSVDHTSREGDLLQS